MTSQGEPWEWIIRTEYRETRAYVIRREDLDAAIAEALSEGLAPDDVEYQDESLISVELSEEE